MGLYGKNTGNHQHSCGAMNGCFTRFDMLMRNRGFFCRARMTKSLARGLSIDWKSIYWVTILHRSFILRILNGIYPVSNSNDSTPTAQMSTAYEYYQLVMSSGAKYRGVPHCVVRRLLSPQQTDQPKSPSFTLLPAVRNTFSGLISRCMRQSWCMARTAQQTCPMMSETQMMSGSQWEFCCCFRYLYKSPYVQYYWIRQMLDSSENWPYSWTMCSWCSNWWIFIQRITTQTRPRSMISRLLMTLRQHTKLVLLSTARYA